METNEQKFAALVDPQLRSQLTTAAIFAPEALAANPPKSYATVGPAGDVAAPSAASFQINAGWGRALEQATGVSKNRVAPMEGVGGQRMSASEAVLSAARAEIGKKEINRNSGPDVERYREATPGVGRHAEWCASFASYVYQKAGVEGISHAGSLKLGQQFGDAYQPFKSGEVPKSGDVAVFDRGKGKGHVGIVEGVNMDEQGRQIIHTIEGNSHNQVERRSYYLADLQKGAHGAAGFGSLDNHVAKDPASESKYAKRDEVGNIVEAQNTLPKMPNTAKREQLTRS